MSSPAPQRTVVAVPRIWPFRRTYYGWAIVFASFAAAFGEVPVFGPILGLFIQPLEEELGWSRATIALGFTIGSIAGSLASVVVGRFVDRYGARVVVGIAGLAITASLLGLATVNEPWQFWALFGLGRGSALAGIEIGTSVAIANWFHRKRALTLAVKGMGLRVGQTVMPFVIFAIMSATDWRIAYVAMAGMTAVFVVLPSFLLLRKEPEEMGMGPDGSPLGLAATPVPGTLDGPGLSTTPGDEISWTLDEARRTRAFWFIIIYSIGPPFVQGATNLHLVANFQDRGLSDGLAVSVLTVFAAVSALSVLPMGVILDHIHVRKAGMLMGVILVFGMVLASVADSYLEAMAFALVFGIAGGMRSIVETLLIANYYGRGSLGAIKGFMAPFRIVSPLGPVFAGFMRDTTGSYTVVFLIFAGVAALMVLALAFATPPRKTVSADPTPSSTRTESQHL